MKSCVNARAIKLFANPKLASQHGWINERIGFLASAGDTLADSLYLKYMPNFHAGQAVLFAVRNSQFIGYFGGLQDECVIAQLLHTYHRLIMQAPV